MYFEQVNGKGNVGNEQMLIFEGDAYREFPEEKWVAAPTNKGIHYLTCANADLRVKTIPCRVNV